MRSTFPIETIPVPELIGGAPATEHARATLARALESTDPVLITAEPGLDVLAVARTLHEQSSRAFGPFVVVDCGARRAALLELDIFGSVSALHPDDFERVSDSCALASASGGTIVLANVTECPSHLQGRLARVLRDGQVDVDSLGRVSLDLRVVATSAGIVDDDLREGKMRRELCARFALRLDLPPLRHRPSDIPALIGCLAVETAASNNVGLPSFSRGALSLLSALPWRRNFHELREVLDVLVVRAAGGTVELEDVLAQVPLERTATSRPGTSRLRDARTSFEREYIASTLQRHRWCMDDAARALGIQRTNLYRKVRQLGIGRPRLQQ